MVIGICISRGGKDIGEVRHFRHVRHMRVGDVGDVREERHVTGREEEEDKEGEGRGESNRIDVALDRLYAMNIASSSCKGAYIRVMNMHTMHTHRYDAPRLRSESAVSAAACLPACLPLWRYTS